MTEQQTTRKRSVEIVKAAMLLAGEGPEGVDDSDNNLECIGLITERTVKLIAAHWGRICDMADSPAKEGEDAPGHCTFTLRVHLDRSMAGRPVGDVKINYSMRVTDENTFATDDPNQTKLPGVDDEATGRKAVKK